MAAGQTVIGDGSFMFAFPPSYRNMRLLHPGAGRVIEGETALLPVWRAEEIPGEHGCLASRRMAEKEPYTRPRHRCINGRAGFARGKIGPPPDYNFFA